MENQSKREIEGIIEGAGGADETLPIVIYVLLKAQPKRLHSNLKYKNFEAI